MATCDLCGGAMGYTIVGLTRDPLGRPNIRLFHCEQNADHSLNPDQAGVVKTVRALVRWALNGAEEMYQQPSRRWSVRVSNTNAQEMTATETEMPNIFGIDPGFTGGVASETFVRQGRDE